MKRFILIITFLLSAVPATFACTNFPINIGALDTPEGRILAETLSVLINERSGVTVGTHYFKTQAEMDKAVSANKLEMIIENTSNSLKSMDMVVSADSAKNFEKVKELYKEKKMIWLKPFAFRNTDASGNETITASVITRKSLSQFPALPRVIGKLAKVVTDDVLKEMVKDVNANVKTKRVAKNFLIKASLI